MNKSGLFKLIGGVIVLIAIVCGVYYSTTKSNDMETKKQPAVTTSTKSSPEVKEPKEEVKEEKVERNTASTQGETKKQSRNVKTIPEINSGLQGKYVTVEGVVNKLNVGKGNYFFTLKDPNSSSTLKAVIFEKGGHATEANFKKLKNSLHTGEVLIFKGKVDVYKGELEIIVNELW